MLIGLGLRQKGVKIGKNIRHNRYVCHMFQVFVLSRVWWHDVVRVLACFTMCWLF